jgi:hypothetical protein
MLCIKKDNGAKGDNSMSYCLYEKRGTRLLQDWISKCNNYTYCEVIHTFVVDRLLYIYMHYIYATLSICFCIPGIAITRYDFSEAQNGKSYCDAKIAHMRGQMRKKVSSGMNILTASDMKIAIDAGNGVAGCQCAHVEIPAPPHVTPQHGIKGISKISDVVFTSSGITTWKAFEIGAGEEVRLSEFTLEADASSLTVISDFIPPHTTEGTIALPGICSDAAPTTTDDAQLPCPEDGCEHTSASYSTLQDHILVGDHAYSTMCTTDAIKLRWESSCLDLTEKVVSVKHHTTCAVEEGSQLITSMGWALKGDRKVVRFSVKLKNYLQEVFMAGERTGRRVNPCQVVKNMRVCRDEDGHKLFLPSEYLQQSQITSYFSRLAVTSKGHQSSTDEDVDAIIAVINAAEAVEEL